MIDEEHKEDTDNSHLTKNAPNQGALINLPEVNSSKNKLKRFKPEKIVAKLHEKE